MVEVIRLSSHRAPVHYTIRLTHHWDGVVEVFVEDVADDDASRAAVAGSLSRAAIQFGGMPEVEAMHSALLARVNNLMAAEANSKESAELSALADVVSAYEAIRWPNTGEPA